MGKNLVGFSRTIWVIIILSIMAGGSQNLLAETQSAPTLVGWIGPLTGNSAVVGQSSMRAIQLAIDQHNAQLGQGHHPIKLLVEDDGYETKRSLGAYHKLVHQDKVRTIFLPTYGAVFALAKLAQTDRVLLIDPLDCNDDLAALPDSVLCLATQTESIGKGFADSIVRNGGHSVMILVEDIDPWMLFVERSTRTELAKQKITEVSSEFVPTSMTTFRDVLLRVKQRKADSLIFLGNDQMGTALKEARELGISAQFYGIGSMLSPDFQKLAAGAIEQSIVSTWITPKSAEYDNFIKLHRVKFGQDPVLEFTAVPSFDASQILIRCLTAGNNSETELLKRCILGTKDYAGLSGPISFDPDGAVRSIQEVPRRIVKGKIIE